jgi:SAM-dependent methyltransferase
MSRHDQETNLAIYSKSEVAEIYAGMTYLAPCEQVLFERYLRRQMSILDLGVGGGRTTPTLSRIASYYVGVDYSEAMVQTCRRKFPDLRFEVLDAADLSGFADSSFDAVVFSYNGLDNLAPDSKRHDCLRECYRVLRDEGILIFSSHNPRSLFLGLGWDQERLNILANKLTGGVRPLSYVARVALTFGRVGWGLLKSGARAIPRASRRLPTRTFWRGEGYLLDPTHGGLLTHFGVPAHVIAELMGFRFKLLQALPEEYPRRGSLYSTRWYYYAFAKN